MVINYKRLNDNTYDDAYKIPNKDSLINSIQGCKYFSQLDCKSGFWKIRLEEDSKPWTSFSGPVQKNGRISVSTRKLLNPGEYREKVESVRVPKNCPDQYRKMVDSV